MCVNSLVGMISRAKYWLMHENKWDYFRRIQLTDCNLLPLGSSRKFSTLWIFHCWFYVKFRQNCDAWINMQRAVDGNLRSFADSEVECDTYWSCLFFNMLKECRNTFHAQLTVVIPRHILNLYKSGVKNYMTFTPRHVKDVKCWTGLIIL